MKVLRIITSMDPSHGGPSQGIRNLLPELKKMGIENEVLCLDEPESIFIEKAEFTVHALGRGSTPWAYNRRLKPWLVKNYDKYDFIIVHGLWQYISYAVRCIRNNKPEFPSVLIMPHGMLDPYFQKAKDRWLKSVRNSLYWKLFESKAINSSDAVLFTSEEELKLARYSFPNYRPKREINIGYGVPPPPSYSNNIEKAFLSITGPQTAGNYILFLGRIHPKKGVDLLVESFLTLKSAGEQVPTLLIAGPGLESKFGQRVMALASGHKEIVFAGMLTGDAKWGAFYNCGAFVLPSHQENFGIAIAEAMSCGKPVLTSYKVNIWREIAEEGAGIIEEDTHSGICKMIKTWIKMTATEKENMGSNVRKAFSKYFESKACADRLKKTLQEIYDDVQY